MQIYAREIKKKNVKLLRKARKKKDDDEIYYSKIKKWIRIYHMNMNQMNLDEKLK
jgi:hypothetical protein